ncbi:hypothetical protein MAPG_05539 [Magnaporthiopsis poae ATCC 64411]|uniref:Uncharacterized protein n=1 Tax=Magnaporthiopsis poae (strain ATCC 64411 / 73-15) TaxID=644358 RepID=A0A0C4DZN3_MAGP6|nr:hypothetical protein MAPG_05539 [Magnaporthiopsis poae ATCC 64411]
MPPARDPRMGRAHLQPSIELDKRRLHEHGVNKANTGSTKKGPPAKNSFRARVECFRPSPPPSHGLPRPREPTPLPENPTEAFFKTLKRELDARHAAATEGDDSVTAEAPRNSSSPPLPPPNVENVTKLEAIYRDRARVLEMQSMKRIGEAHATILAKLDALKQSDKAWIAAVREHQKWTVSPLSDIKLDLGPQKGRVRLGTMAKHLNAQLEKSTAEISKL